MPTEDSSDTPTAEADTPPDRSERAAFISRRDPNLHRLVGDDAVVAGGGPLVLTGVWVHPWGCRRFRCKTLFLLLNGLVQRGRIFLKVRVRRAADHVGVAEPMFAWGSLALVRLSCEVFSRAST